MAVSGWNQVQFNGIGAHFEGELKGLQGVFRAVGRGAAVAKNEREFHQSSLSASSCEKVNRRKRKAEMSHSYHQLIDGKIFMGSADDTQDAVDSEAISVVVDLRGEATKPAAKGDFEWIQIPLGDNAPNAESALYREAIYAVVKAMRDNQKVYFHCGMGRGRTGTVAAGVLLELGQATDVNDAAAKAKLIRPEISIQPVQKQALEQIFGK